MKQVLRRGWVKTTGDVVNALSNWVMNIISLHTFETIFIYSFLAGLCGNDECVFFCFFRVFAILFG